MPEEAIQHEKALRKFAKHIQKGLNKGSKVNEQKLPYGLVPMRDIIPEGVSGDALIRHYEVTEQGAALHNLKCAINGNSEMSIVPGKHVMLLVNGEIMMSDTPYEARSNRDIIEAARGKVLIAGLGMGMVLVPILQNPAVTSVTVVEKNNNVIKLVYKSLVENGPFTPNEKMKLVLVPGDIFDFKPKPDSYDIIYFDIWPSISTKILKDAAILRKQFKNSLRKAGWMGVWVEKLAMKRQVEDRAAIARARAFRARMKAKQ